MHCRIVSQYPSSTNGRQGSLQLERECAGEDGREEEGISPEDATAAVSMQTHGIRNGRT